MTDAKLNMLESAGYQYRGSGEVALSGPARRLFDGWSDVVNRFLEPFAGERHDGPAEIASDVLETAGYLANFPQQIVRSTVDSPHNDRDYLTPAACFHIYPRLADRVIDGKPFAALVMARCARHESGNWCAPFRLSRFHMIELVVVGSRAIVEARREAIQQLTGRMFANVGIAGVFEKATDAFFMANGRGAQLIQQLKELKREYNVTAGGDKVAVASSNYHEDYFGKRFAIEEHDGEPASSFCAAFGIERLTAVGLLTWGPSPSGWPEVFR